MIRLSLLTAGMRLYNPWRSRRKITLAPLLAALALVLAVLWRLVVPAEPQKPPPIVPIEQSAPSAIIQFENRLQRNPNDVEAYAMLGLGLLQRVRETGDMSLYARAEKAFEETLAREPDHVDALIGRGMLANALHNFDDALVWAKSARKVNPWRAEPLGIMVDAYVELGRYEEAVSAAQQMVDLRPGLDSYSRVSYLRELHGDLNGAIQAMRAAVEAGVPGTEAVLWTQYQLANLYFVQSDITTAKQLYEATLAVRPDYIFGRAGLARLHFNEENYAAAAEILRKITAQLPLPEFVVDLADTYEALSELELAEEQRDLVRVMQLLNEDAGMNVDLELAAFEAEYGSDPARALEMAQSAYNYRPTIFAADSLAWALYRNGHYDEAKEYSAEAQRLGTQDPVIKCHAALIERGENAYNADDQHCSRWGNILE